MSTGAFFVTTCTDVQNVASELGRFAPSEVIRGGKGSRCETIDDALFRRLNCCVNEERDGQFDAEAAESVLERHFGTSLAALGLGGLSVAVNAAGTLLQTLLTVQKNDLAHIRELQYYTSG